MTPLKWCCRGCPTRSGAAAAGRRDARVRPTEIAGRACRSTRQGRQVLLCCHRGCKIEDIVAALELKMDDLFPQRNGDQARPERRDRRLVEVYHYLDEHGELLFDALRYEPKDFCQRRPNGNGGWLYNLNGVRRVLYRLPELLARPEEPVHIPKAKRTFTTSNDLGCWPHKPDGCGKWRDEYSELLAGRHVVLLADNDDTGRGHVATVARSLYGKARSVKVIDLPTWRPKGCFRLAGERGTKDKLLDLIKRHQNGNRPGAPGDSAIRPGGVCSDRPRQCGADGRDTAQTSGTCGMVDKTLGTGWSGPVRTGARRYRRGVRRAKATVRRFTRRRPGTG